MKNLLLILSFIMAFVMPNTSFAERKNINNEVTKISISLDKTITTEPQWIYLTGYNSIISGNEFSIFDSIFIAKGQTAATFKIKLSYSKSLRLFFSKTGPTIYFITAPGENMKIDVNEDTPNNSITKLRSGTLNNKWWDFKQNIIYPIYIKIESLQKIKIPVQNNNITIDSISYYKHLIVKELIKYIHQTDEPTLAYQGWALLMSERKELGENGKLEIERYIRTKFPDHPSTANLGLKEAPPASEKSKQQFKHYMNLWDMKAYVAPEDTTLNAIMTLDLPTAGGKKVDLTDINTDYILVDFWASWCKPCRSEIPFLKEGLNKYSNKLTIYAVTLDNDKNNWLKAIQEDQSDNFIHVCGMNKQNIADKQVRALNIKYIPRNFLLDKNRRIIAKNLRGENLIQTLDSLIK